jgi:biopolymer transport protein ExbD
MAGGSSPRTSGGKKRARIEIIPLIDVIFFLLATFVLFTLSLNKSAGIKVALPRSETGVARDPAGTITLSVTAEGAIGWEKEQITADQFLDRLKIYKIQNPEGRILINGDENAYFSQVFGYLIDEVRKAGFQKVFLETKVRPTGSSSL